MSVEVSERERRREWGLVSDIEITKTTSTRKLAVSVWGEKTQNLRMTPWSVRSRANNKFFLIKRFFFSLFFASFFFEKLSRFYFYEKKSWKSSSSGKCVWSATAAVDDVYVSHNFVCLNHLRRDVIILFISILFISNFKVTVYTKKMKY